jgi:hypothetical protein
MLGFIKMVKGVVLGRDTVDSVMSDFTKKLSRLDQVATENRRVVAEQDRLIVEAQMIQLAASSEATRANAFKAKLEALLGVA